MPISKSQFATLKQAAVDASRQAWCPYSNFPVGAALLTTDGQIFAGCNVENASYGLTVCAERNAIGQAISAGCREFTTLLIFTATNKPTTPCGACRQVVTEFAPDIEVISVCDGPENIRASMRDLLPQSFGPHNLDEAPKPGQTSGLED
jgi:cytidine deaminase